MLDQAAVLVQQLIRCLSRRFSAVRQGGQRVPARLLKDHQEERKQSECCSQDQAEPFRKSSEHPHPFRAETSTPGSAALYGMNLWGAGHGYWMRKLRVVEVRICRMVGEFGLRCEGFVRFSDPAHMWF